MSKMINPTNDQLDAVFAEHVAGWWRADSHTETRPARNTGDGWTFHNGNGNFTQSADAVLPWLEREPHWNIERVAYSVPNKRFHTKIWPHESQSFGANEYVGAFAETFPRSAVIALLRAHGVEVEFTEASK